MSWAVSLMTSPIQQIGCISERGQNILQGANDERNKKNHSNTYFFVRDLYFFLILRAFSSGLGFKEILHNPGRHAQLEIAGSECILVDLFKRCALREGRVHMR